MNTNQRTVIVLVLLTILMISGCGSGQLFGPTPTPTPTLTITPKPTMTLIPTAVATATDTGPQEISYTDVDDYMGETVKVCAEVVTQFNRLNDTVLSLGDTPAGGGFLVQFPDPAIADAAMQRDAVAAYYAETVCVTGMIIDWDSVPAIIIDDMQQIALMQ
jgi:hypothetical protein